MPVIKSAKKRMRQNIKRRARNFPVRSELKTTYKKILKMIKDGKLEEAAKFVPFAYSIIDTAVKKNIIHQNNASRKKSAIARALNAAGATKKPASKEADDKTAKTVKKDEKAEKKEEKK